GKEMDFAAWHREGRFEFPTEHFRTPRPRCRRVTASQVRVRDPAVEPTREFVSWRTRPPTGVRRSSRLLGPSLLRHDHSPILKIPGADPGAFPRDSTIRAPSEQFPADRTFEVVDEGVLFVRNCPL